MNLLERVCHVLDRSGIAHTLVGAAALAARGVARSTYDIDLLTAAPGVLSATMWEPLAAGGAELDIRRGDINDPLGGVVRITMTGQRPVDVILGKHGWQQRAIERSEAVPGGPPVVLARDLVLLKLYAGGPQDLWDIRELLRIQPSDHLIAEVDADAAALSEDIQQRWAALTATSE